LRISFRAADDFDFAAEAFFVDRHEAASAARARAENAKNLNLRFVDKFQHAAFMRDAIFNFTRGMRAQQDAVADTRGRASLCASIEDKTNFRRRAVIGAIPFGGFGDQVVIGVANDFNASKFAG